MSEGKDMCPRGITTEDWWQNKLAKALSANTKEVSGKWIGIIDGLIEDIIMITEPYLNEFAVRRELIALKSRAIDNGLIE